MSSATAVVQGREVVFEVGERRVTFSAQIGFKGESNTLADAGQGTHESIVASPAKVGDALQAKGLRAGIGVVLTDDAPNNVVDIAVSVGGGHSPWTEDEFVPTNGQITFILSLAPTDLVSLEFIVNGVHFDDATDYTVSGTTVTWLNAAFVMKTKDKVLIRYQ